VAKRASNLMKKQMEVREGLADLWVETLRRVAPRSTKRIIDSSVQLMEAYREFLAERIAKLQKTKASIAKTSTRAASRKVPVKSAAARRAKRAR
jgi:topoisomerase IA-like protein